MFAYVCLAHAAPVGNKEAAASNPEFTVDNYVTQ